MKKRVEFKLDEDLRQALLDKLSATNSLPVTQFPRDFLPSLLIPYLKYYLVHPEIVGKLIEGLEKNLSLDDLDLDSDLSAETE